MASVARPGAQHGFAQWLLRPQEQFPGFLIPTNVATSQTMREMTIRTVDFPWIGFAGAAFPPPLNHLPRRNPVVVMAPAAHPVDVVGGKHVLRRCDVVLVIAVRKGLPVTKHAADLGLGVALD